MSQLQNMENGVIVAVRDFFEPIRTELSNLHYRMNDKFMSVKTDYRGIQHHLADLLKMQMLNDGQTQKLGRMIDDQLKIISNETENIQISMANTMCLAKLLILRNLENSSLAEHPVFLTI